MQRLRQTSSISRCVGSFAWPCLATKNTSLMPIDIER
jgi:hypothetical protein